MGKSLDECKAHSDQIASVCGYISYNAEKKLCPPKTKYISKSI